MQGRRTKRSIRISTPNFPEINFLLTPSSTSPPPKATTGTQSSAHYCCQHECHDFSISALSAVQNGRCVRSEFDESGLFGTVAGTERQKHRVSNGRKDTFSESAISRFDRTEMTVDEKSYNEAMIGWPQINSSENSALTDDKTTMLNALVNGSLISDTESYTTRIIRYNQHFNERQNNLAVQFSGKPRSEWNKRFDSDPQGPIPAWCQPSAAPACDNQTRYNGYAPATAAPALPLQFSYDAAPVDQDRSAAYDIFLTSPDTTLTPAPASQSEDYSPPDVPVTYEFGDVDVDFHSSFLELFNADDYTNPSIDDEYYRN